MAILINIKDFVYRNNKLILSKRLIRFNQLNNLFALQYFLIYLYDELLALYSRDYCYFGYPCWIDCTDSLQT
jgi:hypothetical protein